MPPEADMAAQTGGSNSSDFVSVIPVAGRANMGAYAYMSDLTSFVCFSGSQIIQVCSRQVDLTPDRT